RRHAESIRRRSQRQPHLQFQKQPRAGALAALKPAARFGAPRPGLAAKHLRQLDDERARAVLRAAAQRADWPKRAAAQTAVKRGRGVAFVRYERTEAY